MSGRTGKIPVRPIHGRNTGNRRIRTMDPERRKALQKTQKKCIAAQVVMCAAYQRASYWL